MTDELKLKCYYCGKLWKYSKGYYHQQCKCDDKREDKNKK